MFAFGRSGFNDLQATGRENLRRLAEELKNDFKVVRAINIVGYTDRIGSETQNMALSRARANTVKAYLVSQGIPDSVMTTEGRGSANPVANCPGAKSPRVIACLMPNRRIEVAINGDK